MRRTLVFVVFSVLSLVAIAQESSKEVDSLWYFTYPQTESAVLTESDMWKPNHKSKYGYYPQTTLTIPSEIVLEIQAMSGGSSKVTLRVTGIGTNAFKNAKATSVVFAANSNVDSIGTLAFSSMANMTGKLVLPASLKKLSVSSILLPNITEIEFLGKEPPKCEEVGGYKPWTSASNGATPATIKVTVPEGYKDAYTGENAPGIGTYFDCLKGTATGITELENAPAKACKVMRNGQLLIEKAGVLYTAEGKVVEK